MRKVSILDIIPPEATQEVDRIGYDFLSERGYDAVGAVESAEKRKELQNALKQNGERLECRGAIDKEADAILVWFEVTKAGKTVARSGGLKMVNGGESK